MQLLRIVEEFFCDVRLLEFLRLHAFERALSSAVHSASHASATATHTAAAAHTTHTSNAPELVAGEGREGHEGEDGNQAVRADGMGPAAAVCCASSGVLAM